ncbi:reverse transcriptase [Trichonephila clavipes]|nr:reverse transcriptase [Trichonephila clavipes]
MRDTPYAVLFYLQDSSPQDKLHDFWHYPTNKERNSQWLQLKVPGDWAHSGQRFLWLSKDLRFLGHVSIFVNVCGDYALCSCEGQWDFQLSRLRFLLGYLVDSFMAGDLKMTWDPLRQLLQELGQQIAMSAAHFCLTTGHAFLGVYLHWLCVDANEACPLCGHARMVGDHLLQCTGLLEYPADDIVSRYWEAQRQMVKKPTTGVR